MDIRVEANSSNQQSIAKKSSLQEEGCGLTHPSEVVIPQPSCSKLPVTRVHLLNAAVVDIPVALYQYESVYCGVLNKESFRSLTPESQNFLKCYLPISNDNADDERELDEILDCAFSRDKNFCFGSPFLKFFRKMQADSANNKQLVNNVHIRKHTRVLYDHYIRDYYLRLFNRVLINRQIILENASKMGPYDTGVALQRPLKYPSERKQKRDQTIRLRAQVRARRIIDHCKAKVSRLEENVFSSDECDEEHLLTIKPASLADGAESTLYSRKFSVHDLDLHQPLHVKDTKELLKEYKHLCETEPECPSCDISDVRLEEVYERSGISFQSERNFALSLERIPKTAQGRNGSLASRMSRTYTAAPAPPSTSTYNSRDTSNNTVETEKLQ